MWFLCLKHMSSDHIWIIWEWTRLIYVPVVQDGVLSLGYFNFYMELNIDCNSNKNGGTKILIHVVIIIFLFVFLSTCLVSGAAVDAYSCTVVFCLTNLFSPVKKWRSNILLKHGSLMDCAETAWSIFDSCFNKWFFFDRAISPWLFVLFK